MELKQYKSINQELRHKIDSLEQYRLNIESDLKITTEHMQDYKLRANTADLLRQNESTLLSDRIKKATDMYQKAFKLKEHYLHIITRLSTRVFVRNFRLRKNVYSCLKDLHQIQWIALQIENNSHKSTILIVHNLKN